MRYPFIAGYALLIAFILWSLILTNFEFIIYSIATAAILGIVHVSDKHFEFKEFALWGFDIWMLLHMLGGLLVVGDGVLYSKVLISIVGEPYNILKYDQIVHAFCYFVFALLMWSVVRKAASPKTSFALLATITVLAATGIGGLNEIIEFSTTLFFDNNVGGYENTALDLVTNLLGALLAVPLFKS